MSDVITLGRSVRQAVRLLKGIHDDVATMLTETDREMGDRGWRPTRKNRITDNLTNGLNADWLLTSAYRIYVPQPEDSATTTLVGIQVEFDPPDVFDEPVCLVAAARFPVPVSFADIWNEQWTREGSQTVLGLAHGRHGVPLELIPSVREDGFLRLASKATAFVVPLCALSGPEPLRDKVIDPGLQMAGAIA